MSDLTDLGESVLRTARRLVEEQGQELNPVWFLVGANGHVEVIETRWRSDVEKLVMIQMIRERLRRHDVAAYVQVSEVWVSRLTHMAGDEAEVVPSEDPGAEDMVMVCGRSRGGEAFMWTYPLTAEEAGRRLGEREESTAAAGKMANLFDPRQVN